jgi:hypothetical protein
VGLNVSLIELTQPGATGNQTYNLAAGFDPKAVILFGTPQTVDGSIANVTHGIGFGTYRGGVVQQRLNEFRSLDAAANSDNAVGTHTDSIFRILTNTAGASSTDCQIELISMTNAGTPNVVLNWSNLHTTASIKIFMLVLGGSDITDALADDMAVNNASATQDETVVAGFGKPDFLFMASTQDVVTGAIAQNIQYSLGFGKQGEAGRSFGYTQTDGNTASIVGAAQRGDRIFQKIAPGGASWECIAKLDTVVANWPTDGFRLIFDAIPSFNTSLCYLALKGTFQSATGANSAPISGGLPVVQDNACGFVPTLGFNLGWNLAAKATIDTASADLLGFGFGFVNGSLEAWIGFTEDDGAATMVSKQQRSATKFIQNWNVTPALQSEADGSFSTTNLRLSWNDIDTVAREYQWFALGPAVSAVIKDLDAVVAGAGTVVAAATPLRGLAATVAGQGTVVAPLALSKALAAAVAGQGVVTAPLARQLSLLADVSGQGAVVVDLGRVISLATVAAAQGAVVADLGRVKTLDAIVQGQGAIAAAMSLTKGLAASVAGQGFVVAQADRARALAAAVAALGQITAAHTPLRGLSLTVNGQGTVVADLQKLGFVNLDAAVQAQGSVVAGLNFVRNLAASVQGQGTIVASIRATRALAAIVAAQGQITASLGLTKGLAAIVQAQGVIVVSLDVKQKWLIPKAPDSLVAAGTIEDEILLWTVVDDVVVLTVAGEDVLAPPSAVSDTLVLAAEEEDVH